MKRIILYFLVVFSVFVAGCRTAQPTTPVSKTEISEIKSDSKTTADVVEKTTIEENSNLRLQGSVQNNTKTEVKEVVKKAKETTVIDFDTNKPLSSLTGKPPVIRETTTTEREITESDLRIIESTLAELQLQVSFNKELTNTVNRQEIEIRELRSKLQNKEKYGLTWWQKTLMGCGVFFIILFLIAIYRKLNIH
jgi:hypothetical protein